MCLKGTDSVKTRVGSGTSLNGDEMILTQWAYIEYKILLRIAILIIISLLLNIQKICYNKNNFICYKLHKRIWLTI